LEQQCAYTFSGAYLDSTKLLALRTIMETYLTAIGAEA